MKKNSTIAKKINGLVVMMALLFSAAGCREPEKEMAKEINPPVDITVARKEIEEVNRNFIDALSKMDSVGLANLYTSDAKFMAPNGPAAEGRNNIQTAFGGLIKSGATKLNLTTSDMWGSEAMMAEEGVFTLASKDGRQLDKGKYIVLWKKEDGKWKLFRDCFNSDLPAVPAK